MMQLNKKSWGSRGQCPLDKADTERAVRLVFSNEQRLLEMRAIVRIGTQKKPSFYVLGGSIKSKLIAVSPKMEYLLSRHGFLGAGK